MTDEHDDKLGAVLDMYLKALAMAKTAAKRAYVKHGREPMERALARFDRLIVRIDAQLGPSKPQPPTEQPPK